VTPPLPFKQGHHVMIQQISENGETASLEFDLNKMIESTGSHKIFELLDKEARLRLLSAIPTPRTQDIIQPDKKQEPIVEKPTNTGDPFDSLWKNL